MSTFRVGYWLSLLVLVLGIAYLGLLIAVFASGGMPPVEPIQSLLHVGILLTAPALVLLWAAIHQVTPAEKRVFSLGSLALMIVYATPASINRYNALTVVPQAAAMNKSVGLEWFLPYDWPSIMLAMEVLSWGYYYGLACLCLAPALGKSRLERALFWTLIASGGLSLAAALGQMLNSFPLSLAGPLAWGPGAILLTVLWARWFKRQETH